MSQPTVVPSDPEIDPFAPAWVADPYSFYAWLREESPCHYVESRDIYLLTRYDDVSAAARNPKTFSSASGIGYERETRKTMIELDPPEHTRHRRMVQRHFVPRAIEEWSDRVTALAEEYVGRLVEAGTVDLVEELANPLPVRVIAEILGVPPERWEDFKRWSDAEIELTGGVFDPERRALLLEDREEFQDFIREQMDERRRYPEKFDDDVMSAILGLTAEGDRLSDAEVVDFCGLIVVAGNETTTNLIGSAASLLLERPDDWQALREDRSLVPSMVEETLRYESPIQGFFRTTTAPVYIAGKELPLDARVLLLFAAANRDRRQYPDPDRYDIRRNPLDHVGFGIGVHLCLGAWVARREAIVVFNALLDRVRAMEPAGDVVRTVNPLLRGVRSLPVRLIPA